MSRLISSSLVTREDSMSEAGEASALAVAIAPGSAPAPVSCQLACVVAYTAFGTHIRTPKTHASGCSDLLNSHKL